MASYERVCSIYIQNQGKNKDVELIQDLHL